jgi:hypothetical protein
MVTNSDSATFQTGYLAWFWKSESESESGSWSSNRNRINRPKSADLTRKIGFFWQKACFVAKM